LPAHEGVQHVPSLLQLAPVGQVPHVPPHPSGPQLLPVQSGVQQVPEVVHIAVVGHVPQVPPHPSGPHAFPVHDLVQRHTERGFASGLLDPIGAHVSRAPVHLCVASQNFMHVGGEVSSEMHIEPGAQSPVSPSETVQGTPAALSAPRVMQSRNTRVSSMNSSPHPSPLAHVAMGLKGSHMSSQRRLPPTLVQIAPPAQSASDMQVHLPE
jgi:hypothetical protein